MNDVSRRSFLGKSSLAAAAAAGAAAVPSVLTGDAAEAEVLASKRRVGGEDHLVIADVGGTDVILHIDFEARGEIDVFVGERYLTFTDAAFVERLKRLTA